MGEERTRSNEERCNVLLAAMWQRRARLERLSPWTSTRLPAQGPGKYSQVSRADSDNLGVTVCAPSEGVAWRTRPRKEDPLTCDKYNPGAHRVCHQVRAESVQGAPSTSVATWRRGSETMVR